MGIGLGLTTSPTIVAVQSVVGWERRGVVTAANMFARSLGSAVGAAIFGAIANATLTARFADPPSEVAGQVPGDLTADKLILDAGNGPAGEFIRGALFDTSHHVFIGLLALALVALVAVLLVPRRTEELTFD
jgi:MFS family permease